MAVKKSSVKMKRKSGNGKVAKAAAPKKMPAIKEPLTKGGMIKTITDLTALPKKDVVSVIDSFTQVVEHHVKSKGPGTFTLPGILKINVVKKAARPARQGINPFTGEPIMIKAKPAHKVVKIKALKRLKEMVD